MTPEDMTPDDFRKIADQFRQACPEFEYQAWKLEALRNLEPEEYSLIFKTLAEARQALKLITTLTRPSPPETVGLLESRSVSPTAAYRLGKYNAAVIAQGALNFQPEGF